MIYLATEHWHSEKTHNFDWVLHINATMPVTSAKYRIAGMKARDAPYTVAERLSRLETLTKRNTPETKQSHVTISTTVAAGAASVFDLTNLAQGSLENQRDGNALYVTGLHVRIYVGSTVPDVLVTVSPHGILPILSSFTNIRPVIIAQAATDDVKELRYIRNFNATASNDGWRADYKVRFKKPILVKYGSSTSGDVAQNRICLNIINAGTTAHTYSFNTVLYFRDH